MPGFEAQKKTCCALSFEGGCSTPSSWPYPERKNIGKHQTAKQWKTLETNDNQIMHNPFVWHPRPNLQASPSLSLLLSISISTYMHLCLSVPTKYMNIITLLVWNFKTGRTQHIVLALIWARRKTSIRIFYSGKTAINVNSHQARDHWIKSGNTCLLSPRLACFKYITTSISRIHARITFHFLLPSRARVRCQRCS